MKKEALSLMLSLVIAGACITGCNNNSKSEEKPAGSEENAESTVETDVLAPVEKQTDGSSGVNPDFKAMMDSYEVMINEYVEFMKKYEESSEPVSMMNDFNTYMSKYTEAMTKLSEIDSSTLSEADLAYYLEVYGRITTKMAEI